MRKQLSRGEATDIKSCVIFRWRSVRIKNIKHDDKRPRSVNSKYPLRIVVLDCIHHMLLKLTSILLILLKMSLVTKKTGLLVSRIFHRIGPLALYVG